MREFDDGYNDEPEYSDPIGGPENLEGIPTGIRFATIGRPHTRSLLYITLPHAMRLDEAAKYCIEQWPDFPLQQFSVHAQRMME